MAYAWRGTALLLEKSHLYQKGRVLRHPGSLAIVATPKSTQAAKDFCRRNGYSWMAPVKNVSMESLEQKI
jgi:hypothetical protein